MLEPAAHEEPVRRPGRERQWVARRLGLRAKFNAVLIPLVAAALAVLLFLDYRHEFRSVMDAHDMHAAPVGATLAAGPIPEGTTPNAVARRTIALHVVAGAFTLLILMLMVNLTLSRFVLTPIARVRAGIERMQRRFRVDGPTSASADEIRDVVAAFNDLGLVLDALLLHALHAERLATLALLSKRVAADIEPKALRLGVTATRLHQLEDQTAHEAAHEIAEAAAGILAAVRRLDRPFTQSAHKPAA